MHVVSCEDQYAKALQGANVVPVCVSEAAQLNGSAVALYNSSSIYDKLLWAATWMYRATGDTDYLGDAESFYLSHIYNEGGTQVCRGMARVLLHGLQAGFTAQPSTVGVCVVPWMHEQCPRDESTLTVNPCLCMQTDLFNWNDYYWAANVLLAEVTDGGTFHQQVRPAAIPLQAAISQTPQLP